ncbi:MAG TPA: pentapeptide repeat-containing protein [Ktedonobacteraceae bacterium]
MGTRLRSLWQQIKQHRVTIGAGAIVFVVAIVIIIIGYQFDWTGFNGYNKITTTHIISGTNAGTVTKTEEYQQGKGLWDWLQLLFVPAVLTLGAVWITARQNHDREIAERQYKADRELAERQHQADRELAADNQGEASLQAYIDKMSELLLHEKLRDSNDIDEVRNIARVRTLRVLHQLDGMRKRNVLLFLYESGLIDKNKRIIVLSGANLAEADLAEANLSGATLSGANLNVANLHYADLNGANLRAAFLVEANLNGALLRGANLFNANLLGADLRGTDLTGATGITVEELESLTKLLQGAIMPDGTKHP